jgi:small redox-active disulfide protein 2
MIMNMVFKILGKGCSNCKNLEKITLRAVTEMGLNASVIKEEDFRKIVSYGVMRTPALVLDEKVILYGEIPSLNELKELIAKHLKV